MFYKDLLKGILLIFGTLCIAGVIFLMYLNIDLSTNSELAGNVLHLDIINTQNHLVNLAIFTNSQEIEAAILKPKAEQKFTINLEKGKNLVEIKSGASVKYSKEIEISDTAGESNLNFNIGYNKEIKLNTPAEIVLSVCNSGADTSLTTEVYINRAYTIDNSEKTKQVSTNSCSDFPFIINPLIEGKQKIGFHIYNNSNNINEEISFDLEINR